jgi:hypothetical protein
MNDATVVQLEKAVAVERVVRPLRASTARKRRIREELLAHLTAIYEEELARTSDSAAALSQAAKRLGDPVEPAQDLQSALPFFERIDYHAERLFGWRAPEPAAKYLARQAFLTFSLFAFVGLLSAALILIIGGSTAISELARAMGLRSAARFIDGSTGLAADQRTELRAWAAMLTIVPACEFLLGMLHLKLRDSLFGAFGMRKSKRIAFEMGALMVPVVLISALAFVMITAWQIRPAFDLFIPLFAVALATPVGFYILARFRGAIEIADTHWACLNLDSPPSAAPRVST